MKVTLIGPTAVAVKWDPSTRAGYYWVWIRVHGPNTDYTVVGTPADLDFTIENLPSNSTIEVMVTAVNNGGESPVSPRTGRRESAALFLAWRSKNRLTRTTHR